MFKVTYNAPVTLTFVIVCFMITGLNYVDSGIISNWFTMPHQFNWKSLPDWICLFTWVFAHVDIQHFVSNMIIILLVGPMLEEKFGSSKIFWMIFATAVATALFNSFIFHDSVIGASGIVFMMVMLGSLTNFERGEIPLTFLFVGVLFIGKEVWTSLKDDHVSQYAHIAGGVLGSIFGFLLVRGTAMGGPDEAIGG